MLDLKKKQGEQSDLHKNNKVPWLSQTLEWEKHCLQRKKRQGEPRIPSTTDTEDLKKVGKGHFSMALYQKKVKETIVFGHSVKARVIVGQTETALQKMNHVCVIGSNWQLMHSPEEVPQPT